MNLSTIQFHKYQGAGNDFIIIDNRKNLWNKWLESFEIQPFAKPLFNDSKDHTVENQAVFQLCHRYFGIGADGLMLLQNHEEADFEMVYFNSDGYLSSMCGNGGRCIAHFAHSLGLGDGKLRFIAPDGLHEAAVIGNHVSLSMNPVHQIQLVNKDAWELNTGSPHYIQMIDGNPVFAADESVSQLQDANFVQWAKAIRYNQTYNALGINVNLVQPISASTQQPIIAMRTYERGVENETLSCGTGVTAAAIAYFQQFILPNIHTAEANNQHLVHVQTKGGDLSVGFQYHLAQQYHDIFLNGPAEKVFTGEL